MKHFDDEKHLLKNDDMDTLHKEFLDIYNSVDINNKEDFRTKLIVLLEHSKAHFSMEENLMDRFSYKTSKEHKEEHLKVLNEMEYFIKLSSNAFGLNMLKSYYKEKVPYWFDLHLISMDSDLAHYLKGKINV